MKALFKRLRQRFSRKGDFVVYRDGKKYRFKTIAEVYTFAYKQ